MNSAWHHRANGSWKFFLKRRAIDRSWATAQKSIAAWLNRPTLRLRPKTRSSWVQSHDEAKTEKPAGKTTVSKRRAADLSAPNSFPPTLGALDLHLFGEGRHELIYEKLGAHPITHEGVKGVSFAVWAPAAAQVSVVGNFNAWDGTRHLMRRLRDSGVWETFVPQLSAGELYKYEIKTPGLPVFLKADPYALSAELPPNTSSIIYESNYRFRDSRWPGNAPVANTFASRFRFTKSTLVLAARSSDRQSSLSRTDWKVCPTRKRIARLVIAKWRRRWLSMFWSAASRTSSFCR